MKKTFLLMIAIIALVGCNSAEELANDGIIIKQNNPLNYNLDQYALRQEIAAVALRMADLQKSKTYIGIFSDISEDFPNNWVYRIVEPLANNGIIFKTKNFYPESKITNIEASLMLLQAAGFNGIYSDPVNWKKDTIDFMINHGLIKEMNNPDDFANRKYIFDLAYKSRLFLNPDTSKDQLLDLLIGKN